MDNTLAYIDQASFLSYRALGRGPIIQFTWIYDQPINRSALEQFHRNLRHGLLGRLIERSPLPFGRHRWVSSSGPDVIDDYPIPVEQAHLHEWLDSLLELPIDPESGPGWRLATTPLLGGGTAISLLVSHSIADGIGAAQAISNAIAGRNDQLGYPKANSRKIWQALRQDAHSTLRSLPELVSAIKSVVALLFGKRQELASSRKRKSPASILKVAETVDLPCLSVYLNEFEWDQCSDRLGGTSNSLLAGLAVRLGARLGRIDHNDRVKINAPISVRQNNDTRANALSMVTLAVDPSRVSEDLTPIRSAFIRELMKMTKNGDSMLEALPLVPFIPPSIASQLEGMALGSEMPVGCSNIGSIAPCINRPAGSDAKFMNIRMIERLTAEILNRIGGKLFLVSCRINGHVSISITAWQPETVTSRECLIRETQKALRDFGLSAVIT
jgi:hypothetical protein